MIRVAIFLTAVALVALGVAWFADRPGDVAVTWLGYRIETSVMVAAAALLALIVAAIAVWSFLRALLHSPRRAASYFGNRRSLRGYRAISRGLIAVGAGDARLARKSADEAARLTGGDDPLALLLSAQAAQLSGERGQAERAFRKMAARPDTKLLGLRGLYIEAQRRDDAEAVRLYAEEAAKASPSLSWATQAALDSRAAAHDWAGALGVLDNMKRGLPKEDYRRQRAVLLTALAMSESDRDAARAHALEAAKLAPDLVPAAALAGRFLSESGDKRKATKLLQNAWVANPHPDIAEAYAGVRLGISSRERLKRVQALVEKSPGGVEGALAVARAAIDAKDFAAAREALKPHLPKPTRRVATLMAEIEEQEHGDEGRARQWMARAMHAAPDPAWTADGAVSEKWLPVSPVTGRLDAFQWRVPVSEIGFERPAIEGDMLTSAPKPVAPIELPPLDLPAADSPPVELPPVGLSREFPVAETPTERRAHRGRAKEAKTELRPVEAVIPLVHAPDDPGPDDVFEPDPKPEASSLPPGDPLADTWQKLRGLFRP